MKALEAPVYGWFNWGMLIASFEVEVLVDVMDDDYQGDAYLLVRDAEGRYGYLCHGFGSCSGCDAAEGCDTLEEATELRDDLWARIEWRDTAEDMATWLRERDWRGQYVYWRYGCQFPQFMAEVWTALGAEGEPPKVNHQDDEGLRTRHQRSDCATLVPVRQDTDPGGPMRRIEITDEHTGQRRVVDYMDVADTLDEWNPGAPEEVWQAITDLQELVVMHKPTTELQAFLAIRLRGA